MEAGHGARDAEVAFVVITVLNHLGDGVAVDVVEVGERVDDVILTFRIGARTRPR